ncbi:MAG: HRDC domain-containing protein [Anaerolineales bacterium]|nr:HRDC domain-containing protein [Anaerolineales bacterium]
MHTIELPEPTLVTTQTELDKVSRTLAQHPLVAVDTEANSLYAYREQVCLIQFSTPDTDYLVDPLALEDLSPLGQIFNDPAIEKIFHAAEYDLIILQRDFGFSFDGLFDTMLASRILGLKSVGLSSLLESYFGVNVDKKYQRANWGRRPLPAEMLSYAQMDTHYLIPLRHKLKTMLQSNRRWELAQEDFRRACHVNAEHNDPKPVNCWRINGSQYLEPRQLAVLHELCHLRDQKARALDRPLFKVISDKSLINIAIANPDSPARLERVPGVSHKQVRWIGRELLEAVRIGHQKNPPRQPRKKRPSDQYLNRVDTLRQWRKTTARHFNVESDVILPKDLLYDLAENNPQTPTEITQLLHTVPWRLDKFGDEIFHLLRASK